MIGINLTFDFELFFGTNKYSAEEILFTPTEKIISLLNQKGVKATFYADVLSVFRHNDYNLTEYISRFEDVIKKMILQGHDVQLHIHSNWLRSTYENGQWQFDTDSYRIHTFGFDNNISDSAGAIIKKGKQYLESVLQPIKPSYRCIAYRAGGYSIQPHNQLFHVLSENNIFIDSSIALQKKANHVNQYDYMQIPKSISWWISPEGDLFDEQPQYSNGFIYEVPVYFTKNNLIRRLFMPSSEKNIQHENMKGSFITIKSGQEPAIRKSRLQTLLEYNKNVSILSFDSIHYKRMLRAIHKVYRKYNSNTREGYMAIIGHPKLCDKFVLANMESFLNEAQREKSKFNFVTASDVFANLEHNNSFD